MNRVLAFILLCPVITLGACCCEQCRDGQPAPRQDRGPAGWDSETTKMTASASTHGQPALAGPPASPSAGGMRVVNAMCVINVEHPVQGGMENARYTAYFKDGQRVGFCCEDCMDAWAAMSPAEKEKAVAEALAAGRKM